MTSINEIFTENRFPPEQKLLPILLYLPIGLLIATVRIFIGLQVIIAAVLLHRVQKIRSVVLRFMFGILGVFVFTENKEAEDDSVKLIVSNHVSILDHLAIHLLRDSASFHINDLPSFFHYALKYKIISAYDSPELLVHNVKKLLDKNTTIDIQPELGTTSGKMGLLRFCTWPCKLDLPVQPVTIRIQRPSWINISPSVINASWSSEIFWFLFVPFTHFIVRFSPVIIQDMMETPEEMTRRLEKIIADDLKIIPTNFTIEDKVEYEKRLYTEKKRRKRPVVQNINELSLTEMAGKIKEVLPDVPINVICKDLAKTKSIDMTMANIIEGLVKYIPEKSSCTMQKSTTTAPDKKESLNAEQPSTSFDTSSKIFHKSAQERMVSFQERKRKLIQSARQRYIEKHALNIMNSS